MAKIPVLLVLVSCFLFSKNIFSQLVDGFEDGEFLSNPAWTGTHDQFVVNVSKELQLKALGPGKASLGLNLGNLNFDKTIIWEFYVNLAFAPSLNNRVEIQLLGDLVNNQGQNDGIFVRIGESGSEDKIRVFKRIGGQLTLLCSGANGIYGKKPDPRIQITRDQQGKWTVKSDPNGNHDFQMEGSFSDNEIAFGSNFGIRCKFTSSNKNKFYFDDFHVTGELVTDKTPPNIDSLVVVGPSVLNVHFNEELDSSSAISLLNYEMIPSLGGLAGVKFVDSNRTIVQLEFVEQFVNDVIHMLTVSEVKDTSMNTSVLQDSFYFLMEDSVVFGDVIINEILADPVPSVGLPEAEFIELYSTSPDKIFELGGWLIKDLTGKAKFPEYILRPKEHLIVCSLEDTNVFNAFGNVIGIKNFPTLNNDKDAIVLVDEYGNELDSIFYISEWHTDPHKAKGGYSFERIYKDSDCGNLFNWKTSVSPNGGSPNHQNSVNNLIDSISPQIISANLIDVNTLNIELSELVDTVNFTSNNFIFDPKITLDSWEYTTNPIPIYTLTFDQPIDSGLRCRVIVNNLQDCHGNIGTDSTSFYQPFSPVAGDIIINEVLFYPNIGGHDFVEIYNNSSKPLNLDGWTISNSLENQTNASTVQETRFLNPGEYLAISTDTSALFLEYHSAMQGQLLQVKSLPSLPKDSGQVVLSAPNGIVSDYMNYHRSQHFQLLKSHKGVSLERLDFNRSSLEVTNWHSAAHTVGYATPGRLNSQLQPIANQVGGVELSSDVFSPDGDGFEDLLHVHYTLKEPGFVCNAQIYNHVGVSVFDLAQSQLLEMNGTLTWDGVDLEGQKARVGPYVVLIELFHPNGETFQFKKSFSVASRNN